ncbi:MAG: hypothetical protein DKM50_06095 [Candidatus Margulisiibacteriota bacterium]|nr:MAG: hypothetical protein A2X43_10260 [Candidatus Margulisbacteria bacterium GWD2_39_127]OGI05436.1 MAG: hypothetical protein A2X42_09250 [Candidatus Margulisbacteria bacterium GWF2_38_17]OGI07826.1 MAG: hypothetical protein A2X41_11905 [Candidatus Margulisbacteria bacterium GWE2_39_32]PZM80118.1 MAG: hypothetical protein DKM50_06095 [Candidatus Margulisiibacteriota bacterium]HAR62616.1 hypothetical protein [Candidatus Margulisiibacteriota bacterium]
MLIINNYAKKSVIVIIMSLCLWFMIGLAFTDNTMPPTGQDSWLVYAFKDLYDHVNQYSNGGTVGISIKDLTSEEYISINGDIQFNPASVIKVPVMAEVFHQLANGKLTLDKCIVLKRNNKVPGSGGLYYCQNGNSYTIKHLVEKMITESDNTATNMLINFVGMNNINKYMNSLGLSQTVIKDDTMLSKKPGYQNTTTPDDMLLLLDMMYQGKLVNKKYSLQMLEIMSAQKHKWGIRKYLPETLKIANKTGSLNSVRNDIGIIFVKDKPYILTIFAKQIPSDFEATLFVRTISKLIYDKVIKTQESIKFAADVNS